MTYKKCKKCGHKQELKDGRKAKTSWICSDCRYRNKLRIPVMAMITLLALTSIGIAFAEEQPLPVEEPYDDKYCTFYALSDHVNFTCTWKWFLPSYVMEELEPLDIPLKTSDIPQHNIELADKIRLLLEKGIPDTEVHEVGLPEVDEPTEPLTFEQRQIKASIEKLDECLRGIGAWAAYQTSNTIEFYVDDSRYSYAIRDNLSQNIHLKRILLAIEECDIMRTYERMNLIGDYELNKVLADIADKDYLGRGSAHPLEQTVTDQSDSMVATDPITERDRADELADMERIVQDLIEQKVYKDPYAELPDENLQPAGILCQTEGQPAPEGQYAKRVCPLDSYNELILSNADTITYEYILGLQCVHYFDMYEHKVGTDDFPTWLNHCLIPKDQMDLGIQEFLDGDNEE